MIKRRIASAILALALCALGGRGANAQVAQGSVNNGGGGGSSLPFYSSYGVGSGASNTGPTANTLDVLGFTVPAPGVTLGHLGVYINVTDSVNKYDFGVYNSSGTLVADVGAQSFVSTGLISLALVANSSCTGSGAPASCCTGSGTGTCPSSVTLLPGLYFYAMTGNAATAKTVCANTGNSVQPAYSWSTNYGTSASGILPASITAPSESMTTMTCNFALAQ